MTVASTTRKTVPSPGNGVTTSFPFAFKVFANADLSVQITVIATGVSTTLVLDSDYHVILNADQDNNPGGSITYPVVGSPLSALNELQIVSNVVMTQALNLPAGGGQFNAQVIEDSLDKAIIGVQQLQELGNRSLSFPPVDVNAGQIPNATARALMFLAFNLAGDPIAALPVGGTPVSVYMQGVVAAANPAAALTLLTTYSGATIDAKDAATLAAANAAGIQNSIATTKGDGVAATGAGVFTRVPVGATGLQLTADAALANGVSYEIRNLERSQCPLAGVQDTAGNANFLTTGAGLLPGLSATSQALLLAFGAGYDAGGNIDLAALIPADAATIGTALPASNTSYINATYTNPGAVAWGQTLAPPQHARVYDQTKQSVLQFGGVAGSTVFLDDFGNTWAAQGGAKVQTNQIKFGTGALGGAGASNALNGTTDYVKSTNFTTLGGGGWSLRGWIYCTVLPGANLQAQAITFSNAGGFGAMVGIVNNAGTIRFGYSVSSNGTSNDIAANSNGTTLPVVNTWYFVELTYDALAGAYRLYVGGTQEQTTASALRACSGTAFMVGGRLDNTSGMPGYIDKPEILPYCQHPAGTSYAGSLPAAAPSITAAGYASDFYNITTRKMFGVTGASGVAGTNPTFTAKSLMYAGEADTSGAAVTAVRSYAYKGRYQSADTVIPAAGTRTAFAANLGSQLGTATLWGRSLTAEAATNFTPGMVTMLYANGQVTNACAAMVVNFEDRNVLSTTIGSINEVTVNRTTGAIGGLTAANWKMFVVADRGW